MMGNHYWLGASGGRVTVFGAESPLALVDVDEQEACRMLLAFENLATACGEMLKEMHRRGVADDEIPARMEAAYTKATWRPGDVVECVDDSQHANFLVRGQRYRIQGTHVAQDGTFMVVPAGHAGAWPSSQFRKV